MITLKKDDFGFYLVFWVKQRGTDPTESLSPRDISEFYDDPDLDIYLRVWAPGSTTHFLDEQCEKDAAVDLSTGKCLYEVGDGDFDTLGTFNAELRFYKGTAPSYTWVEASETFKLRVIEGGPDTAP